MTVKKAVIPAAGLDTEVFLTMFQIRIGSINIITIDKIMEI
jgi:hypothetical protein